MPRKQWFVQTFCGLSKPFALMATEGGAMEIDSVAPAALQRGFSFNLLHLIKSGQAQHGLRHNDHKRYRTYCTDRLRRLYKSLKFTHGRGKFIKRSLVVTAVTDVRHLHIALYSAERAWSYAMDIKDTSDSARGKHHLIRRLKKACKWADLLETLCNEKADSRTALDATAYASYMQGLLLFETRNNWQYALRKFKNASAVYEELGRYGDVEDQILCRQRVEELEPNIRYCVLMMDQGHIKIIREEPEIELLQGKLETVMAQARTQQEISTTTLEWLGRKYPVHSDKTRACVLKAQELEKDLSGTSLAADKKLAVHDKIAIEYQNARKHIRDDLVAAGNAEDVRETLNGLDKALSCILFASTIERGQLLVFVARNRLKRLQQEGKSSESLAKLEELVSLYDTLINNVTELSDLTTSGREVRAEESSLAMELSVKRLVVRAERCFYLAQSYSNVGKYAEAFALFRRAQEHAQLALESQQQLQKPNEALANEINELVQQCRAHSCLVHARGVMQPIKDEDKLQSGVASMSLEESKEEYLLDHLEEYKSALRSAGTKEAPQICRVPPAFRAVPCRPIFLDTASYTAQAFPSLDARLKKEEKKKGFFGRIWGS